MSEWKEKGCQVCRHQWEAGERPRELAVSYALHTRLHRCDVCGTFWEQHERFADVIGEMDALRLYKNAFPKGPENGEF